jgi:hypothetical protein
LKPSFVAEGLRISDGDVNGSPPFDLYFQLIEDYGRDC